MDWQERSRRLVGEEKIEKLGRAHVLLFGLGGVGSFAAEALVRSGLGLLSLVEFDEVADSNRNRQLPALENTVGMPKIEVAAARLRQINPGLRLFLFPYKMNSANLEEILHQQEKPPDFIADAIDDLPAKVSLITTAQREGIPLISAMGAGFRLDPSALRVGDISETHTCPLARKLRRGLRDAGIASGVPVIWSTEKPIRPPDREQGDQEMDLTHSEEGFDPDYASQGKESGPASMIFVPAAAGLLMASYIVRQL